MPRCFLLIDGADHDVTNLIDENLSYGAGSSSTTTRSSTDMARSNSCVSLDLMAEDAAVAAPFDWSQPLYPNLLDPCNRRMMQDVSLPEWKAVSLITPAAAAAALEESNSSKMNLYYEQEELLLLQQQQQEQEDLVDASESVGSLQRAQTAPLHRQPQAQRQRLAAPQPASPRSTSPPGAASALSHRPSMQNIPAPQWTFSQDMDHSRTSTSATPTGMMQSTTGPLSPLTPSTPRNHPRRRSFRSPGMAFRQQQAAAQARQSTTAVPGDIQSSSSGLRPRVNYKSLYTRGRNSSSSSSTTCSSTLRRPSCPTLRTSISGYSTDETAALDESGVTMLPPSLNPGGSSSMAGSGSSSGPLWNTTNSSSHNSSRRLSLSDLPCPEDDVIPTEDPTTTTAQHEDIMASRSSSPHSSASNSSTMEIAPNVRVPVRSSRETYDAVRTGEYTVATCFVCASTLVCTHMAAYVLCPDCQVVSPIRSNDNNELSSDTKKDDPYGVGTGLKREWIHDILTTTTTTPESETTTFLH